MKDALVKIITNWSKIKSMITLYLVAIFGIMALRGDISPEDFKSIVLIIVGFYFGTQKVKEFTDEAMLEPEPEDEPDKLTPAVGFQIDTDEYHED